MRNPKTTFESLDSPKYTRLKRWVRFMWIMALALVAFFFVAFGAVDLNVFGLFGTSPTLEKLQRPELARPTEVYSADGVLLGKYYKENRAPVGYEGLSPYLVQALLATEDIRFEEHSGIDPVATVSIFYYLAKGDNRGGSTITQQLSKNLFKTRRGASTRGALAKVPGVSTVVAKMKEWITSVKLEKSYTKREIITMYFNTVDFGSNSFGIKAAAKTFFSKSPEELKVEEAAMLVGMLKATTGYNPRRNYDRALRRRNTVLQQMEKYGFLTAGQYDSLTAEPIVLNLTAEEHSEGPQDYYNQALTESLERWGEENDIDIYTDGLKIYTTIDTRFQDHAYNAVREHMYGLQRRFNGHIGRKPAWIDENGNEIEGFLQYHIKKTWHWQRANQLYPSQPDSVEAWLRRPRKMQVFIWEDQEPGMEEREMSPYDSLAYYKKLLHPGFVCMDPTTGHIKAWVGGLDFSQFKYDHVKQSRRQPGSTFKAFVYATAIDRGKAPCDREVDRSFTVSYDEMVKGEVKRETWNPGNATGYFSGMNMTLRYAIGRSINSVTAHTTNWIGTTVSEQERARIRPILEQKYGYRGQIPDIIYGAYKVAEYAQNMGIKSPLRPVPSIGLGPNDVSLLEMVAAYGCFLNQGFYTEPMLVSRIEDEGGNTIKQFTAKTHRALTAESAWLMLHMLKGTLAEPGGTAQALFSFNLFRGNELAGKTGTSQNQSDGWFIGLSKTLVAGAWCGAEERAVHFRTLRAGEGSKTALPMYGLFMERLYMDRQLGVRMGYMPRPKDWNLKIRKPYTCVTRLPKPVVQDTTAAPEGPQPTDTLNVL